MSISTSLRKDLAFLDDRRTPMVNTLRDWCAINSGSLNLDGLESMHKALSEGFDALDGDIEALDSDPKPIVTREGEQVEQPLGKMLRVVKRPQAPVRVLLTGHMDTVFGVDHSFQSETMIDDDTMNAPGAADMKGGLLVMLNALLAVENSSLADQIGYEILINADEEIGSQGSDRMLREAAGRAHFACIYEPALPDGTLAGARKGSGNFAAIIRGKSAHAGREHHLGRNAIAAAADFIAAVDKLTGAREGLTVNVARVDGGGPDNVVPDMAVVRFNVRLEQPEDAQFFEKAVQHIISEINDRDGYEAELAGKFTRPPKPMTPKLKAFFESLKSTGAELGIGIDWVPTGGCCDGNNIAAAGIPVIDTLGVRGANIHSSKEYAKLDSLVERSKLSALLLLKIAAGELPNPGLFEEGEAG